MNDPNEEIKRLREALTRAHHALTELRDVNHLSNDWDAYLYELQLYGDWVNGIRGQPEKNLELNDDPLRTHLPHAPGMAHAPLSPLQTGGQERERRGLIKSHETALQ